MTDREIVDAMLDFPPNKWISTNNLKNMVLGYTDPKFIRDHCCLTATQAIEAEKPLSV